MISFSTEGKDSVLETEIVLERDLEEVFSFFADAFNLEKITPPILNFKVITPPPIQIGVGTHIDYDLKLHGIPIMWRSHIPIWEPPYRFVDEQVMGPYLKWYHQHNFSNENGRTIIRDKVNYRVPGGKIAHQLLVKKNLELIFGFRSDEITRIFSS